MPATSLSNSFSHGFTIVETIVVLTVLGLLTGLLFGPLDDLYISNTASSAQTTQDSDTRSTLRQIAGDLTNMTEFVGTIGTPTTPTGSNDTTGAWNGSASTLMASVYATDKPTSDPLRKLVNAGTSCDFTSSQPFIKNTYIYFVKAGTTTLYRRTMINTPNAGTPCTSIAQTQSCASTVMAAYSSICKSTDAVLLKNVASFTIDYYASSDPNNPISPITTTNIGTAHFAKISITTRPASATSRVAPTTASIRIGITQ